MRALSGLSQHKSRSVSDLFGMLRHIAVGEDALRPVLFLVSHGGWFVGAYSLILYRIRSGPSNDPVVLVLLSVYLLYQLLLEYIASRWPGFYDNPIFQASRVMLFLALTCVIVYNTGTIFSPFWLNLLLGLIVTTVYFVELWFTILLCGMVVVFYGWMLWITPGISFSQAIGVMGPVFATLLSVPVMFYVLVEVIRSHAFANEQLSNLSSINRSVLLHGALDEAIEEAVELLETQAGAAFLLGEDKELHLVSTGLSLARPAHDGELECLRVSAMSALRTDRAAPAPSDHKAIESVAAEKHLRTWSAPIVVDGSPRGAVAWLTRSADGLPEGREQALHQIVAEVSLAVGTYLLDSAARLPTADRPSSTDLVEQVSGHIYDVVYRPMVLWLTDEDQCHAHIAFGFDVPDYYKDTARLDLQSSATAGAVGAGRRYEVIPDIESHEDFQHKAEARREGWTSAVIVPIYESPRVVLGSISVYSRDSDESLTEHELSALVAYSEQAGTVLGNRHRLRLSKQRRRRYHDLIGFVEKIVKSAADGPSCCMEAAARVIANLFPTAIVGLTQVEGDESTAAITSVVVIRGGQSVVHATKMSHAEADVCSVSQLVQRLEEVVVDDISEGRISGVTLSRIGLAGLAAGDVLRILRESRFVQGNGVQSVAAFSMAQSTGSGEETQRSVAFIDYDSPHHFEEDELMELRILCRVIDVALMNAKLLESTAALAGQAEERAVAYRHIVDSLRKVLDSAHTEIATVAEMAVSESEGLFLGTVSSLLLQPPTAPEASFFGAAREEEEVGLRIVMQSASDAFAEDETLGLLPTLLAKHEDTEDDYSEMIQTFRESFLKSGAEPGVLFPLVSGRGLVGVSALQADTLNQPQLDELLLMRIYMSLIGLALDNALQYDQVSHELGSAELRQKAVMELASFNKFAGNVLHRFNNSSSHYPVMIQRAIGLLEDQAPEFQDVVDGLREVEDGLSDAVAWMNRIGDLGDGENEVSLLAYHDVSVAALVQSVLYDTDIRRKFTGWRQQITVHDDGLDPDAQMYTCQWLVEDSITVIVENAIEAMAQTGGHMHLECGRREVAGRSEVFVAVRDSGPGIDEDKKEQVFQYGFSTKDSHLGIGLWFVETACKAIGATVECHSTVGEGTEFVLRFSEVL